MSLFPVLANSWVLPAAVPYIAVAGYDFYLHGTDRRVPRIERTFHAIIISSVVLFLALASLGKNGMAGLVLGILLLAAAIDELRFHGELETHERRLHFVGGAALMFCIGVWLWTI
jgi:Sec-independent protein secretion pathway component TatC